MKAGLLLLFFAVVAAASGNCPDQCVCQEKKLTCVEKELYNVPDFRGLADEVQELDLSSNEIETLNQSDFASLALAKTKKLNLTQNGLIEIEETALQTLQDLEFLDLSNNLLEKIPSLMVVSNEKLIYLDLSSNFFEEETPQIVSNSLASLDLSFSQINKFTNDHVQFLPNLKYLYLKANHLRNVDYSIFLNSKSLAFVEVVGNIWECSCNNVEFFDTMKKKGLTIFEESLQCFDQNGNYLDMYTNEGPVEDKAVCNPHEISAQAIIEMEVIVIFALLCIFLVGVYYLIKQMMERSRSLQFAYKRVGDSQYFSQNITTFGKSSNPLGIKTCHV